MGVIPFLHPRDGAALKTATRLLFQHKGGLDVAAMGCRVGVNSLHEYQSLNHMQRFAPIDVVAECEVGMPVPFVTAVMAQIQGYMLVPMPKASGGPIDAAMAAAVVKTAKAAADHMLANADGKITEAERAVIAADVAELLHAVHMLAAAFAPGGAA